VLELCAAVDPEFIARVSVYSRTLLHEGHAGSVVPNGWLRSVEVALIAALQFVF